MPKGIQSIDELFANIDVDEFVKDYEKRMSISELNQKYDITPKLSELFLKSLISMGKIKKIYNKFNSGNEYNEQHNKDLSINSGSNKEYYNKYHSSKLSKIDSEINDMLLGISDIKNQEINNDTQKLKPENTTANEKKFKEIKNEFIFLWDEGVPIQYLMYKFQIGINTFKHWKSEFNLGKRVVHTSKIHLNNLRNSYILLQIEKHLAQNNGVMFFNDLINAFSMTRENIMDLLERSDNIKLIRLSFPSYIGSTQDSVKYFKNNAFEILLYLDIKVLLKKLFYLLNIDAENNKISDENNKILLDLLRTRLGIEGNIFQLLNDCDSIREYRYPVNLSIIEERMEKTKKSISTWQDVESYISLHRPIIIKEKIKADEQNEEFLINAIINFLELRGKEGSTSLNIYLSIKETYPNYAAYYKKIINKLLLDEEIVISHYKGKYPCYVLSKFSNGIIIKQREKDYGKKIEEPLEYIDEILQLEKGHLNNSNNQTTRLAGLFIVRDYRIKHLYENEYFDFLAISNENKVYVKIDLGCIISTSYLLHLHGQLPTNSSGVIINFNNIDPKTMEFLQKLNQSLNNNQYIKIWNKNNIINLVKEKNYEPSIPDSLVKIMDGIYEGFYGKVVETNFSELSQIVQILGYDDKKIKIYLGNLNQLHSENIIVSNIDSYTELLRTIMTICTESELSAGLKTDVSLEPFIMPDLNNSNYNNKFILTLATSNDETHIIKLNFNPEWNGFILNDKDNYNDTPQNFCKNKVISCDCLRYIDQTDHKILLCRHLVASLIEKWRIKQNKKSFPNLAKTIKFFVYDVFIIYRFFLELAYLGNIDICKLLLYIFSIKLLDYCEDLDFLEIVNFLKKAIQDQQINPPKKLITKISINNKIYSNQFFYNYDDLHNLVDISMQYPQLNGIFKDLNQNFIYGCVETLNEIIGIFFIKADLSYFEFEHFIIESLRKEMIEEQKLIHIIRQVWENKGNENITQCIQIIKKSIKN